MKKKVQIGFIVFFVVACCLMAAALATSVLSGDEGFLVDLADDGQAQVQVIPTPVPSDAADSDMPEIRWMYPVKMISLYSDFNVLVNRDRTVSESFGPAELIKTRSQIRKTSTAVMFMDRTAENALAEMFEAAQEAGIRLFLKSGHRNYKTQATIYENYKERYGTDDGTVAPAGASEHQTGLSCDMLNLEYGKRDNMTPDFSETIEAIWMKENCAEYGFILRYPENKKEITQTIFEPWHFRYVGKDVAGHVMRSGMCFEEFWDEWQYEIEMFKARGGDVDEWMAYERNRTKIPGQLRSEETDKCDETGDPDISIIFY